MKKTLLLCVLFLTAGTVALKAQALFAPITTTNYNFDAVAEANSSSLTTTGAIDGSNYVMHSMAYAGLYSMSVGLPNSGLIAAGSRTFQLQPYTQNNTCFLIASQVDSIELVTPAPYNALSVLGFATEGAGTMNVTVRFTDNTTQVFNNISVADWFTGTNNILNGFGRTNRTTGVISSPASAPNLYPFDFNLSCPNRSKNVKNIKFNNTGTNPRLCLMALSGASNASTITATSNPVTCQGGTNGSASVVATGGTPPYTYSWTTSPAQLGSLASGLSVGTYTCIITDAGNCSVSTTVAVNQTLVTQPSLFVSSNGTTACMGNTVALAASGANSYTWSTGSTAQLIIVSPSSNTTYTVGGYNSSNCYLTGSISIVIIPLPTVTITSLPASLCVNSPSIAYSYGPLGGNLSAPGFTPGVFEPSFSGAGLATISYTYTDSNGCSGMASTSTQINPLPTVTVALGTQSFCTNSAAFNLSGSGSPSGGTFSGPGVSGSVFTPASAGTGTALIIYSYTDANNCSNSDTTAAMVYSLAAPSLSVARNGYCPNSPNIQIVASPTGGTYTGTAVNANGLFSPQQAGIGTFTVSYSITSGVCTMASAITLTVNSCAGLQELNTELFELSPNPNNGTFIVTSPKKLDLLVFDNMGRVVLTRQSIAENTPVSIQLDNLAGGIYYVKAYTGNETKIVKIVVTP
ncbi:MAG: T9SS type A sorting domain-containing protein [Bacteroidia bacterium]|nr:T9SS type A sorting domain-containing protein [Bacteroidia bacterium]